MPDVNVNNSADNCSINDEELIKSAISLLSLKTGMTGTIVKIAGGRGACKRLNELGLTPGTKIEMVNNVRNGPVMIKVKGSKLAIGRGLARKVLLN